MSGQGQERAEVQLKDIARPPMPERSGQKLELIHNNNSETYFGSKLVQALAEYSGNFRHEFPHTHVGTNESHTE